jgi:hypothetical protein
MCQMNFCRQVLKRDKLAKRIRQTNLKVIIIICNKIYYLAANVSFQPTYIQIVLCLQIFFIIKGKAPRDCYPPVLFVNQLN